MPDLVERLRVACELADLGLAIERQNLRRAHPHADDDTIEAILAAWRSRSDAPPEPQPQPL
jgi:Rv0078B-related antitoxin